MRRHVCLLWARRPNLKRKACVHRRPRQITMRCSLRLAVLPCRRARECSSPADSRAGLSCVDDSTECVEQRQATLKAMLADKDRGLGQGAGHAARARLGRAAVCLPQQEDGALLRGAGAWPQGGRRCAQGAQGRPRPFAGTDFPGVDVRCRGQQGTGRGDEEAPLQGLASRHVHRRQPVAALPAHALSAFGVATPFSLTRPLRSGLAPLA